MNNDQIFNEGLKHIKIIKEMSFENKQKAINSCQTIVEEIATTQSDIKNNDLSRQLVKT